MLSNRRRAASSLQEARSSGSYRHRNSSSSPLAPRPTSRLCLAATVTNSQKRSVCTSWGISGKDLYLLHALRKRMEYPELKRAVLAQAEGFNASVVLIEDEASGTQPIQELVELGLHAVTRYQPQSYKIVRSRRCQRQRRSRQAKLCFAESMHAQTAMIE